MSFILPLLFIICSAGTLIFVTKRSFGEVLPVSLIFSSLIVFAFAFCGQMLIGYYITFLIAIAFPIIFVILAIRHKDCSNLFNNLFNPVFCIFIIIYAFIFFLNYNRGFTEWDEISHWGPMVKEILRLDKLYSVPQSVLSVHKDYPPIASIFEAIWCKLCGGYKEAYLYRSMQTLALSLFLPALSKLKWKKNFKFFVKLALIIITILSVNLVIRVGEASFYLTIDKDCLLGLMLAYSLFIVMYENKITKFGVFSLCNALAFLLLTKQMGLVFFLLVLSIFVVNYIILNRTALCSEFKEKNLKKRLIPLSLILLTITIIPYMFQFLWNKYISSNGIPRQFNISSIHISDLIGIAKGTSGLSWQHKALANFIKYIADKPLFDRPVSLSYWQLMFLAIFVFWLIGKYGKKYFENHQITGLNIMLFFGAIGYAFAMLLLYVFDFGPLEGPSLASIYRYLNTYWFAVFNLAMMLFLFIEVKKETEQEETSFIKIGAIILFMWIILFDASTIKNFIPAIHYNSVTNVCYQDASILKSKTKDNDKIFIISQKDSAYKVYMIIYLTLPRSYNRFDYSLGTPYNVQDVFTQNITLKKWQTELAGWDYLYLQNVDEQFISKYSGAFKSQANIKNKQLYKIIKKSDNTIVLDLVK